MDPVTREDGTSMMTSEEPPNATAGGAPGGSLSDNSTTTDTAPGTAPGTASATAAGTAPGTAPGIARIAPRRFELDKSKIISDIQFFCDSSNWREDSDDEDTTVPQDDPNGVFMEADENEPEEETRTMLYRVEVLQLVEALSKTSTDRKEWKEGFLDLIRQNLPVGVELTPKRLSVMLHPDKFLDKDIKKQAHDAFTSELCNYCERKYNSNSYRPPNLSRGTTAWKRPRHQRGG